MYIYIYIWTDTHDACVYLNIVTFISIDKFIQYMAILEYTFYIHTDVLPHPAGTQLARCGRLKSQAGKGG